MHVLCVARAHHSRYQIFPITISGWQRARKITSSIALPCQARNGTCRRVDAVWRVQSNAVGRDAHKFTMRRVCTIARHSTCVATHFRARQKMGNIEPYRLCQEDVYINYNIRKCTVYMNYATPESDTARKFIVMINLSHRNCHTFAITEFPIGFSPNCMEFRSLINMDRIARHHTVILSHRHTAVRQI